MEDHCLPGKEEVERERQENHHDEEQQLDNNADDGDEALSLCDLPLTDLPTATSPRLANDILPSPEPAQSSFQFFTELDSYCCSADDIILSGRLLPLAPSAPHSRRAIASNSSSSLSASTDSSSSSSSASSSARFQASRSESKATSCSSKANHMTAMTPSSRSLDFHKLRRSKTTCGADYSSSRGGGSIRPPSKGSDYSDTKEAAKFPWYWMMFGMVRFPVEMELKDMKHRQLRRHASSTILRDTVAPGKDSRSEGRSQRKETASWRLISALSCKNHGTVAVTSSFCSVPDGKKRVDARPAG